jgi:hypothetical protein
VKIDDAEVWTRPVSFGGVREPYQVFPMAFVNPEPAQ